MFYPKTDMAVDDGVLRALRHRTAEQLGLTGRVVSDAFAAAFPAERPRVSLFPEQGTFHRLFLAELPDGRRYVVRFSVTDQFCDGLTLHLEQWAGNAARRAGIPVPEVVLTDTTREVCPFDFQVVACCPDRSLGDFDDKPAMRHLLPELGAMLARLHGVAARGFGWPDVRPLLVEPFGEPTGLFVTWQDYLLLQLDRHVTSCRRIGVLTAEAAARIRGHFAAVTPWLLGFQSALLHGDPGSHNVRTDGRTISALLDWEDCLVGDPAYEVAFWATFHPERRHGDFLEGYRAVRPLPGAFDVRFWLYFLRVALAKTVHRHRFGYADRPDRPPASGRIGLALGRLESALS